MHFSVNNVFSQNSALKSTKKRCPKCQMVNFSHSKECVRCRGCLIEVSTLPDGGAKRFHPKSKILRRAVVCITVCLFTLLGFYLSLLFTSKSLGYDEKKVVANAVKLLDEKGFSKEVLNENPGLIYLSIFHPGFWFKCQN